MDAFNDILNVENEAEQAINTAKSEAEAALLAARKNHDLALKEESLKLQEAEKALLAKHNEHVAGLVNKIQAEAKTKIASFEKRFLDHKVDLKSMIKKSF